MLTKVSGHNTEKMSDKIFPFALLAALELLFLNLLTCGFLKKNRKGWPLFIETACKKDDPILSLTDMTHLGGPQLNSE